MKLRIQEIVSESGMSMYRIAKKSQIPYATLNDICSGKARIEKCSAETLYKLSKVLRVPMESLIEDVMRQNQRQAEQKAIERSYEYGLPGYLQHDLDAYKKGLKEHSSLLDCLWGELYGSINIAQINDGAITPEHADYLRKKYLFGGLS